MEAALQLSGLNERDLAEMLGFFANTASMVMNRPDAGGSRNTG
jgi:hypothetical protein